jgi:hypothetical protein
MQRLPTAAAFKVHFIFHFSFFLREPPGGAKRAKHRAKHERTVLRSKNKGTKCTFVVSEPQHQLWVQWVRERRL